MPLGSAPAAGGGASGARGPVHRRRSAHVRGGGLRRHPHHRHAQRYASSTGLGGDSSAAPARSRQHLGAAQRSLGQPRQRPALDVPGLGASHPDSAARHRRSARPLDDDRGRDDSAVLPRARQPADPAPGHRPAGRRHALRPAEDARPRHRLRDRLSRLKSHQQLQSCSTDGNELLLRIQTPSHNTQNIGKNLKQHTRAFSFKLVESSIVNTQRSQ